MLCSVDELKLVKVLMADYDYNVRPVQNYTDKIVVRMNISLVQILDLVSFSFMSVI